MLCFCQFEVVQELNKTVSTSSNIPRRMARDYSGSAGAAETPGRSTGIASTPATH
jgi:hypothetical protein